MENIIIREAGPSDLDLLQQTGRQTFYETFAESNSAEDMTKYLEEKFSTTRLKAEISNTNSAFYLAFNELAPAGYLKLNFGNAQTEPQDKEAMEIERIYVLKQY